MRQIRTLGLLMAALVIVAGCTTASAATAKGQQGTATNTAEDRWADDAQLAGIFGVEGSGWGDWDDTPWAGDEGRAEFYFGRASEDDNVGDGKCEVWAYVFIANSKPTEMFVVVVAKDGEVIGNETMERDSDDMDLFPVGSYDINSDEALGIAKEHNTGIREGLESANFGIFLGLGRPSASQNPYWVVGGGGGDSSGGGGGFIVIDATDGDIVFNSDDFGEGGFDF